MEMPLNQAVEILDLMGKSATCWPFHRRSTGDFFAALRIIPGEECEGIMGFRSAGEEAAGEPFH